MRWIVFLVATSCSGCNIAKIEFNYVGHGFLYRPIDRVTFEKEVEIMAKSNKNSNAGVTNEEAALEKAAQIIADKFTPASVAPASTQKGFIPKSWREVVGKLEPSTQPTSPIVASAVIAKVGNMANSRIHTEFTLRTIRDMLNHLDGKMQFTLQELATAAGFNDKNRLNQIVGSADFRTILRSLMLGGRIVAAPKGRGASAATNVEAIKAASNALGEI